VTVIEGLLMGGAWLKQKFNSLEAQSTAATLDPPLTRRNEGCAGRLDYDRRLVTILDHVAGSS
jgi:hypothetical protein